MPSQSWQSDVWCLQVSIAATTALVALQSGVVSARKSASEKWRACGGPERMHVFTIKYNQRLNMVEWCWMLIASCFHLIFGWEVARTFPLNLCHRSFYHSSLQVQVVNHEQLRTKEGLRWVALWLLPVFPEPMWAAMFTDHLVSSWSVDWLVPDDIRLPAHGPKPTWHEQPLGIFLC